MRFVPTSCIREGMVSAGRIIGKNGELLLNTGAVICPSYITRIEELGFTGIYIDDALSEDIEISDVISSDLRNRTVKTIKNIFIDLEKGGNLPGRKADAVNKLVSDIVETILANKNLMVNMVDLKVFDDYTFYHSVNVGVLCIVVGAAMALTKKQLHGLGLAAMLHDIGKVFVPKEILSKPGKLSNEEYEIMKAHSLKGYEYIKEQLELPTAAYVGVLHHHERVNGSGYPHAIPGPGISLYGRIIAVADVYDALISNRPYRSALIPSEAMEYVMGGSDSLFDAEVVGTFVQKIAPYPIGMCVLTSDNRKGIVVENYTDCCLRPKIRIVKQNGKDVEPYYLDLCGDRSSFDVTIVGITDIAS